MTEIEEQLDQPKATASEDLLNYPVELNSRLAYLQNAVDSADSAPTKAEIELAAKLETKAGEAASPVERPEGKRSRSPERNDRQRKYPAIGLTAKPESKPSPPSPEEQ